MLSYGKFYDVNLINFIESFPDETSCKERFKEIRDKEGVICRKCGNKDHYWLGTIWQYQCKTCKTRTTLRSGTVMQASKLPFKYWFLAIHLLTGTKKTFSALELQRQLGHKYYEPVWFMLQKLRKTMGVRDQDYTLGRWKYGRNKIDVHPKLKWNPLTERVELQTLKFIRHK